MQEPLSFVVIAHGPFSSTLPLLLDTGPKLSDATQRKLKVVQSRKYTYVEMLLNRSFSSKVKNSQNCAMASGPVVTRLVLKVQRYAFRVTKRQAACVRRPCCDRFR